MIDSYNFLLLLLQLKITYNHRLYIYLKRKKNGMCFTATTPDNEPWWMKRTSASAGQWDAKRIDFNLYRLLEWREFILFVRMPLSHLQNSEALFSDVGLTPFTAFVILDVDFSSSVSFYFISMMTSNVEILNIDTRSFRQSDRQSTAAERTHKGHSGKLESAHSKNAWKRK